MGSQLFLLLITLVFTLNEAHSAESTPSFPVDVTKFIEDRVSCDHFRGEPRDFDESYKRQFGEKALKEEEERAVFLERMTKETCANMDTRLRALNKKYADKKNVADKLAGYEYLEIGSGYVHFHKNFPNARLLQEKLIAKGFMSFDVKLMEGVDWRGWNWNHPLPSRLTIQIGSIVDIFAAQLAIETLLEYGPKDLGVVVLPKENRGLGLSMLVGTNPFGKFYVYTGDEIRELLEPNLTRRDFDKFAKQSEAKQSELDMSLPCAKEMATCNTQVFGCVSLGYPFGSSACDANCQAQVREKLIAVGASIGVDFHPSLKHEADCVGYRRDLGGDEEGARCLAKALGYTVQSTGCSSDGFPYNVRAH